MGKSAKAFKRLTKKQKEIKKGMADKAAMADQSTPSSSGRMSRGEDKMPSNALARTSGGGVGKTKTTKLKAKAAAAAAAAATNKAAGNAKNSNKKRKDYLALFAKK